MLIRPGQPLRLAFAVLAVATVGVALWSVRDWRTHMVVTSSMAPAIPAGSLALVTPAEPDAIRPGDVLAFQHPVDPDGPLVAHRVTVVVRTTDAVGFATRGDANERSDSWLVGSGDVEGRVEAHLPVAGALLAEMRDSSILLLAVTFAIAAALLSDAKSIVEWLRHARSTPYDQLHQRLRALASDTATPWRSP